MTETNKRLSRREAIKILGTTTGASLLANIPAKWSKPELTGASLPAHAQTSNCPAGSSAMSIFVEGSGDIDIGTVFTESVPGTVTNYPTGVTTTVYSGCISECFYMFVTSGDDTNNVHTIVTLNGSVIYNENFINTIQYYVVNGVTGAHVINDNAPGCSLG